MSVMSWLPEGDPAIRWQVMRDLMNEPGEVVATESARRPGGAGRQAPRTSETGRTMGVLRILKWYGESARGRPRGKVESRWVRLEGIARW
jgi:hypothetical protein